MSPKKVAVAMSGGVDSSIAAALLVDRGYEVIGVMMRLWSEPGSEKYNRCCTPDSMLNARRVAALLDIPFYVIDARSAFYNTVVNGFTSGYLQGITPNPCLACNRFIRWGFLLKRAILLGADYFATGHYASLVHTPDGDFQLHRAFDLSKDQSYVLYSLDQNDLSRTLLPLGSLYKSEVRQIAQNLNFPIADRPDSQDLCFLGGGDYRNFLLRNIPDVKAPGQIVDITGNSIGVHDGLAFYTIGQRKGLGINSQTPLFVIDKEISTNTLIVGSKDQLGKSVFFVSELNWIEGDPPGMNFSATVQIRYKANEAPCNVSINETGDVKVNLNNPLRDITPGQAAVFYNGKICLGGGIISSAE